MLTPPLVWSLTICVAAASLEAVLAGRGVHRRFAELRLPPLSPPLAVWVSIGVLYYALCFFVLYRLLAASSTTFLRPVALGFLIVIMLSNAGWGYLFFRRKDLRASFLAFIPYGLLVLALAGILVPLDPTAAWLLLPYIAYLGYATWWGRRLWRLNEHSVPGKSRLTHS